MAKSAKIKAVKKTKRARTGESKPASSQRSVHALAVELSSVMRRYIAALEARCARHEALEKFAPLLDLQPKAQRALLESAKQMKRRPGRPAAKQ